MKFNQKTKIIKTLLFLSIFSIVAILLISYLSQRDSKKPSKEFESSSKLAYGKGISFFEYHGDKKLYSLSIDSFSIERARLGPFAIGPLHIAHLNKVNIDLYLDGIESRLDEVEKLDFENLISNIKKNSPLEIKRIKGIELKNISLSLWKNEKRIFRISSDAATVDRKAGDIIFTGHANMDANENGKLISHRIRWNRKTRFFKVVDPYYLIKNGKRMEGRGIETDYLFKKINNLVTKK